MLAGVEPAALAPELATTEADWVLAVALPSFAPQVAPDLTGRSAAWVPAPLSDREFVIEARARQMLSHQIAEGRVPRGEALGAVLAARVADDRRRLLEIAAAAYRGGTLATPHGALAVPADGALVSLTRVLEEAATAALDRAYPEHYRVAPPTPGFGRPSLEALVDQFFIPGHAPGAAAPGDGLTRRLGLAQRASTGWRLVLAAGVDAPAARLLACVDPGPEATESLYWRLRKGPLGVTRPVFETLLIGLCYAGHLAPLGQGRRLTARHLDPDRIAQVRRESPLSEPVFAALKALPRIPARLRNASGPTQVRLLDRKSVV